MIFNCLICEAPHGTKEGALYCCGDECYQYSLQCSNESCLLHKPYPVLSLDIAEVTAFAHESRFDIRDGHKVTVKELGLEREKTEAPKAPGYYCSCVPPTRGDPSRPRVVCITCKGLSL